MAEDTTKTVLLLAGIGVGGYLFYEWSQYNNAIQALANAANPGNATAATATTAIAYATHRRPMGMERRSTAAAA